jgi:tetraacyldisaccharide-1-P 4'-kinase
MSLLERSVVRRLAAPPSVAVVAVGGATFGGSGKTPLAIACAEELARAGARVVLVGHAYRALPGRARFVAPDDPIEVVGDEALMAARALEAVGGRVVVAPSRADALSFASRSADVVVLDGVAQLCPAPATLALLAVDPDAARGDGGHRDWGDVGLRWRPWRGLRAPASMLLAACDAVVPMGTATGSGEPPFEGDAALVLGRPMWPSRVESRGAWVDEGTLLTWDALREVRVGLLVALGRPERVLRGLERRGVVPRAIVRARDHGPFGPAARWRVERLTGGRRPGRGGDGPGEGVDLWLATAKCMLHAARALPGVPVAVLDHSVALHPLLRNRLRAYAGADGGADVGKCVAPRALTGEGGTNSLELPSNTGEVQAKRPVAPPYGNRPANDEMRPRA